MNDNFFADPNTNNAVQEQTWGQIIFHETAYEVDWVFVAWIEYDGRSINLAELEYFRTLDSDFEFTIIEEVEVNQILENMWFDNANNPYITVKDFVFTDNTPELDIF